MAFRQSYQVDILIRGWGQVGLTRALLSSLFSNTPAPTFQVIYVDNGSEVDEAAQLMRAFPQVTFVRLPFNHGSVRAINIGLELAMMSDAQLVMLMDNDTEIPEGDEGWLARMMGYFDDPTVGAAGAVSDYVSGNQHVDIVPDRYTREWSGGKKAATELPVLVSFAMMLRKDAIKKVGGFDEANFEPGNYEDYDYTLRLREAGYKLVIADSVWVHHRGSQTFGNMGFDELLAANESKFVAKWGVEKLAALGIRVS
jgi:GT2 family glycosyltransferase